MNPWQKYIDDVLSDDRIAGRLERLAVERFLSLCEKPEYEFREDVANAYLDLVGHLRHTKGKFYGKRWQLMPWQAFFFAYIFGLCYKDTGLRVVRKVLLCMAKKGGKSEVGGALGVIMSFFDGEQGAECYSAANKYDQARFCWDAAKEMIKQLGAENDWIGGSYKLYDSITTRSILNLENNSFFKPIAADAKTLDGVNPHLSIVDEYHEASDTSIPDNLESGMVAREQPLLCIVTTRGFNSTGVLRQLEKTYIDILEGKAENDSVFPLIFSLDEDDDWQDESVWPKANPGIGIAPSWEGLREQYKKAITEGATSEINFRTKNMNVWTNVASVWIQDDIWMRGATSYGIEDLAGRKCYAGLDLAQKRDIAALSLFFPPMDGEPAKQITRYYCPKDNIKDRSRKDRVPYENWVDAGWLTATPGDIIDYDYIKRDIYEVAKSVQIELLYYDTMNASMIVPELIDSGLACEPFAQRTSYFHAPISEIERLLFWTWLDIDSGPGKKVTYKTDLPEDAKVGQRVYVTNEGSWYEKALTQLDIGKDPIMRWMAGNVVIMSDSNGNRKFDKSKCREKIDGMVALAMAVGGWLNHQDDDPYASMDWDGFMAVLDKRK